MHVSEQETPLWLLVTESGPSVTQYDLARSDGYPLVSGRGQLPHHHTLPEGRAPSARAGSPLPASDVPTSQLFTPC